MNVKSVIINIFQAINKFILQCIMEEQDIWNVHIVKKEVGKKRFIQNKISGIIAEYNPFHNGHLYHIEKAKELRNATPMVHNCAQTIMEVYADDLGINKELANHLGCNFGGGMKCGSVCGAITSGLMILGAKGIDSPAKVNQFIKTISNNHHGLINCADLLKENAKNGGQKKPHCDGMIQEVIELIDQMEKENDWRNWTRHDFIYSRK